MRHTKHGNTAFTIHVGIEHDVVEAALAVAVEVALVPTVDEKIVEDVVPGYKIWIYIYILDQWL